MRNPVETTTQAFEKCKSDVKNQLKTVQNFVGQENFYSSSMSKVGQTLASGINNAVGSVARGESAASRLVRGVGSGVAGTVSGVAEVLARPGLAISGLINIAEDPINSGIAVAKGIQKDCREDAVGCAGKLMFEGAMLVVPVVGAANIANAVGKAASLAKASKYAGAIGNYAKATRIGVAATHASHIAKTSRIGTATGKLVKTMSASLTAADDTSTLQSIALMADDPPHGLLERAKASGLMYAKKVGTVVTDNSEAVMKGNKYDTMAKRIENAKELHLPGSKVV